MHAQELAPAFYEAIGQRGHVPDSVDLASAHKLIECYGFGEVDTLLPGVVTRMAAETHPVPRLADAIPYFAQVALEIVQSAPVKQRNERERRQRREDESRAHAEREQNFAAFQALSRPMQSRLIREQRESTPIAPEYFIKQLAARKARELPPPASKRPNQTQQMEQWKS